MTYRVWGDDLEAADFTSTSKSQRIEPTKNIYLGAVRVGLIVYNNPVFTDIECKIYSDEGGSPSTLLYTSTNKITKSELHTEDNAVKDCAFLFNGHHLQANRKYHVVLNGAGYAPVAGTAFLAWQKDFPDYVSTPQIASGFRDFVRLGIFPYRVYLVGSEK